MQGGMLFSRMRLRRKKSLPHPPKVRSSRTTVKARQACAVIFFAATLCVLGLAAQTRKTPNSAPRSPAQEPLIRVESNLVRVPVFVYFKYGLDRAWTEQESRCHVDESSRFLALSAQEPFLPTGCDHREVKNLTLEDFRLFEEGEPQKIQSLERERWLLLIRDNRIWHNEISDTPNGVWSTTDLADSFQPWDDVRENYTLGYVPARPKQGCHQIRVDVRRPKVRVLAREAYCAGQTPSDILDGTKTGEELEFDLAKDERAKLPLFVEAGTFRGGTGRPLVDVVLEFSWSQLSHYWDRQTGKIDASIGVLGAVYAKDGKLVTRFSDLLWPAYWPATILGQATQYALDSLDLDAVGVSLEHWDPAWLPTRYETQFNLPAGEYELRVVLSDGKKFGRAKLPLVIENYDGNSLGLGSVFLCNRFRDAHAAAVETAAANFAPQYVPLVSNGVRVTPAGDTRFGPDTQLSAYFEIYEPSVAVKPAPRIQAHLRIVTKDGAIVKDFPPVDAAPYAQPGSITIPLAREVPISTLSKGDYRLEVQASDSTGRTTPWRAANFTITDKK